MKSFQSAAVNLLIGLIFGAGLVVSGMSNPAKVLNFLDVTAIPKGGWDPSLAFVMGGAVLVAALGYRYVLKLPQPLLSNKFHVPTRADIDSQLVSGAAIFGFGWGLAGFCPGPAFTALVNPSGKGVIFVVAMLIGMAGARWYSATKLDTAVAA